MSRSITTKAAIALLSLTPSLVFASGFQLFEYNGESQGNYGAGGAAIAEDASTSFTNPAGLVRIDKPQVVIAGTGVWTSAKFKGQSCGGSQALGLCPLTPVKDNGGASAVVPAAYISAPIDDTVTFGLGLTVPFGLTTEWSKNKVTGYNATKSKVETLNINPNLGVKVTDKFSFGFGADAMEFKADLNSRVGLADGVFPSSEVKNHAESWGYGWNAGALYEFSEDTRVGLSYRSQINQTPGGTSGLSGGSLTNTKSEAAKTQLMLPPTTMLSLYHAFDQQKWAVMGTVSYTDWTTIENITLRNVAVPTGVGFGTTTGGTVNLPQDFRATWRAAVGLDYWASEKLRLRVGGGYDKTPVKDQFRTLRLPDEDRYALSVGAHYVFNKEVSVDAGYTHIFVPHDASINQSTALNRTVGHVDNYANLVGLQLNWTIA